MLACSCGVPPQQPQTGRSVSQEGQRSMAQGYALKESGQIPFAQRHPAGNPGGHHLSQGGLLGDPLSREVGEQSWACPLLTRLPGSRDALLPALCLCPVSRDPGHSLLPRPRHVCWGCCVRSPCALSGITEIRMDRCSSPGSHLPPAGTPRPPARPPPASSPATSLPRCGSRLRSASWSRRSRRPA